MSLNFPQTCTVSAFKMAEQPCGAPLTVCLSSTTACLWVFFKSNRKPTTWCWQLYPSCTCLEHQLNSEHQSAVDRLLISTHMFRVFVMRYLSYNCCERRRERARESEANREAITAKSISHLAAFRRGEWRRAS